MTYVVVPFKCEKQARVIRAWCMSCPASFKTSGSARRHTGLTGHETRYENHAVQQRGYRAYQESREK